jgi:hypothetical protein
MNDGMNGSILIEIVIALAIFTIALAGVMEASASARAAPQDIAAEREADMRVSAALAAASAALDSAWGSSVDAAGAMTGSTSSVRAWYASPCLALLSAEAGYGLSYGRSSSVARATLATNPEELGARGGDCGIELLPPDISLAAIALPSLPSPSTAIDALDGFAYIGLANPPYLAIVDLRATPPALEPLPPTLLPAAPSALDAVEWREGDVHRVALYAALATTTGQLATVDATDPALPQLVSVENLAGVDSGGSYPQGWRVRYYGGRLYATTRETSGPELHTFDASDRLHPRELGAGIEIGITINDFDLADRTEGGVRRRYLFAATDRAAGEAEAFDVTDPGNAGAASEILADRIDMPGTQNAESIALAGSRLYAGRASSSGPDLYAFDASSPGRGLPLLNSFEIGSGVIALRIAEPYAFLETSGAGAGIRTWDLMRGEAVPGALIGPLPGMPAQGIDLDDAMLIGIGREGGSSYSLESR